MSDADTYGEALEDTIEEQKVLDEEKKERRKPAKKTTPAKAAATVSEATERARARVREKLAQ